MLLSGTLRWTKWIDLIFTDKGAEDHRLKTRFFISLETKETMQAAFLLGKIVTALFRALANWQSQGCRGSGAAMELLSLNSLEFVSPEPQLWCQSFGFQRMDRLSP